MFPIIIRCEMKYILLMGWYISKRVAGVDSSSPSFYLERERGKGGQGGGGDAIILESDRGW